MGRVPAAASAQSARCYRLRPADRGRALNSLARLPKGTFYFLDIYVSGRKDHSADAAY